MEYIHKMSLCLTIRSCALYKGLHKQKLKSVWFGILEYIISTVMTKVVERFYQ